MARPKKKVAPKAPKKRKASPKRPKRRNYKKEYARRVARAEILARALGVEPSRSVARGHPRRDRGEVGFAELRRVRAAARLPSVGERRRAGEKGRLGRSAERVWARERVAELAGLSGKKRGEVRGAAVEQFAEMFVRLGLGTTHQAYTLWFSP